MKIKTIFSAGLLISSIGLMSGCSDEADSATTAGTGASTENGSLGDSTPTGRITADGFHFLFDPPVPEAFDSEGNFTLQSVVITAFADDVNDLGEVSGQTVNFKAEWGSWLEERDSCVLSNGTCSVTWQTGARDSAPGSCRVAITAWTTGEETFFDANGNGLFEASDNAVIPFTDLEEPFLDIDDSNTFDGSISTAELVGELIDIINFDGTTPGARSGDHDSANGLYDGSLCAAGNALCNPARTAMIIHHRSNLRIQAFFDETGGEDINGNGIPDETDINFCGSNPF